MLRHLASFGCILVLLPSLALAEDLADFLKQYHFYAGNTHSHTAFTWSHGEQWERPETPLKKGAELSIDAEGGQSPSGKLKLKPDWQKHQGPPAEHFRLAKEHGYDFYVTSDHSQEVDLQPPSPTNPKWLATKQQATTATDENFVALAGYEHSENNGPDGFGHINVINSDSYLNALGKGIHLRYLYQWLKTAKPNGDGPIVASFNHPGAHQYADWAYRDDQVTDIITMLEVINSNNKIHYEGFLNALDHGWKVSPVCGNDNHGFFGILHHTSRTFVLATEKTKVGILDAMKHRRTYASLDTNLHCIYSVNGQIMGSTLSSSGEYKFDIWIDDPDKEKPGDAITKIDIVKDNGKVVQTYKPAEASQHVEWKPTIHDASAKYFFVRVYNAAGGDAPKADPAKPVAWLAPVWTGK